MWVTIHQTGVISQKCAVCTYVPIQFLIFVGVLQKWCFNKFLGPLELKFTTLCCMSRIFSAWSSCCCCIVECIHFNFVCSKLLALREWSGWLWCYHWVWATTWKDGTQWCVHHHSPTVSKILYKIHQLEIHWDGMNCRVFCSKQ